MKDFRKTSTTIIPQNIKTALFINFQQIIKIFFIIFNSKRFAIYFMYDTSSDKNDFSYVSKEPTVKTRTLGSR